MLYGAGYRTTFGGWAATLIDSLDTLYLMGFTAEFDAAVAALDDIDFDRPAPDGLLNVFETTIRYLGGLLAAYDLSGRDALLESALRVGELLYAAFDTPNRMPVARWNFTHAAANGAQTAQRAVIAAEAGSLSLEFTRLAQLSGDPKFYDAVARVADVFRRQQLATKLPGLWPLLFNAEAADTRDGDSFGLGAMADSLYEYLPKMWLLLGGRRAEYRTMYETAMDTAKQTLFFRAMNPADRPVLFPGAVHITPDGGMDFKPEAQHLGCFVGGMLALGARALELPNHLRAARRMADGCAWAYEAVPAGIMPEVCSLVKCGDESCRWDEALWKREARARAPDGFEGDADAWVKEARLPPGFVHIANGAYQLRPEAIESVFYLYRITGDPQWMDKGWKMFQAIERHTRTDIAHAMLEDVTKDPPPQVDKMESFWTAETLKYFYLLFSEPGVVSLDEYVLNTEAHPFKRPVQRKGWV